MSELNFPIAFILIAGAVLIPFLRGHLRSLLVLVLPLLVLTLILLLPEGHASTIEFLGFNLVWLQHSQFGIVFAVIFSIVAFVGNLYAYRQANSLELSAALLYSGSAIGVVLAGDLITLFIFWELMAVGSTLVIWSNRTKEAHRAGLRYVLIHLLGGVILMVGIAAHVAQTGDITFKDMTAGQMGFAEIMILIGVLVNIGAPPISAWIADAYPEASPSGSVFLSAFTTKTAVYVLIVGFAGTEALIYIGLYMVFYGIIYALLENDMRRILAYSVVSQVGFMVTGIGIGTDLALAGVAAHAFSHIIYKALLLMSAGSVLYQTGKRKCTDLGGLFQTMPKTALCGIIGALAISAFPLTSGFISKSMVSTAAADQHLMLVWFLFTAATAGTFFYAGLKFPWFVFFQKDSGMRPEEPPANMRWAMYIFAFFCLALGVYPAPLYDLIGPTVNNYNAYSASHVISQLQLLLFSGLAFFVLLPLIKCTLTISLDFDWLYRKLFFGFALSIGKLTAKTYNSLLGFLNNLISSIGQRKYPRLNRFSSWSQTIEGMLSITLLVFGLSLLLYLFYSIL